MNRVHPQQQGFGKKRTDAKEPAQASAEIHHEIGMVLKIIPDLRQGPVFLRPRKEDQGPLHARPGRQRFPGINHRRLHPHGNLRRALRRQPRQINRPALNLRRRLIGRRHRHQREKLVVDRRPVNIGGALQIFALRRAAEPAAGEPGRRAVLSGVAVVPHGPHRHPVVIHIHRRRRAHHPLLRRQQVRFAGNILQPHRDVDEVIGRDRERLFHAQPARQILLRLNAGGRAGQRKIAISHQLRITQNRQRRHQRVRIQRRHLVGIRPRGFLIPQRNCLRITG